MKIYINYLSESKNFTLKDYNEYINNYTQIYKNKYYE